MLRRARWKVLAAGGLALAAVAIVRSPPPELAPVVPLRVGPVPPEGPPQPLSGRIPSGAPPLLSCVAARAIVAQINTRLVQPPQLIDEAAFGASVADWLDPHGLWSAAPASAPGAAIRGHARELLAALRDQDAPKASCAVALEIGRVLARTTTELRGAFDTSRARAATDRADVDRAAVFDSIFEPGDVKRPAHVLAEMLGARSGNFEKVGIEGGAALVDAARERYFPSLTAESWADAVLAAAVRAYVPAVDPHGGWAPFEEEASLYESEIEARPPAPFWESVSRTPVGIRIDAGPVPPLSVGDLVLSIEGIPLGGMPLEQLEQLAYTLSDERARTTMLVLSEGAPAARVVTVELPLAEAVAATREGLTSERVRYGDREALVIAIRDVREDLGEELAHELERAKVRSGPSSLAGVILDLRGNGGGSTDGAAGALGLFLPGAPLFPMKRRDGTLEIDRATEPPEHERFDGPVAALVDRSTASAAEMIAGALGAYHRGVVVGERTFGKGCAQEYVEDEADVGVLRLTTLVFALPDGSPLQRTGLMPSILVPFDGPPAETEGALTGAPLPFRGPDVRDARRVAAFSSRVPWPAPARGDIGPCKDEDLCRGVRALASAANRRAARR